MQQPDLSEGLPYSSCLWCSSLICVRAFLIAALSFSSLCGLLIGHQVVCVDARFLVFSRWQQTATDRRVLLKHSLSCCFLFHFIFLCIVYTQTVQQSVWDSVTSVTHAGAVPNGYNLWRLSSFLCTIKINVFCVGVKHGRWHWGRNIRWGCLRTGCWGEYLGLREMG